MTLQLRADLHNINTRLLFKTSLNIKLCYPTIIWHPQAPRIRKKYQSNYYQLNKLRAIKREHVRKVLTLGRAVLSRILNLCLFFIQCQVRDTKANFIILNKSVMTYYGHHETFYMDD